MCILKKYNTFINRYLTSQQNILLFFSLYFLSWFLTEIPLTYFHPPKFGYLYNGCHCGNDCTAVLIFFSVPHVNRTLLVPLICYPLFLPCGHRTSVSTSSSCIILEHTCFATQELSPHSLVEKVHGLCFSGCEVSGALFHMWFKQNLSFLYRFPPVQKYPTPWSSRILPSQAIFSARYQKFFFFLLWDSPIISVSKNAATKKLDKKLTDHSLQKGELGFNAHFPLQQLKSVDASLQHKVTMSHKQYRTPQLITFGA